jgi:hypothetical protein
VTERVPDTETAAGIQAAFAEVGLAVTVRGEVAHDAEGRAYGLAGLLADIERLRPAPDERAPLLRMHVRSLVEASARASVQEPAQALVQQPDDAPERVRDELFALVLPAADARDRRDLDAAPEVAPGLREFYALERPEGVGTLSAAGAAGLGEPAALRAVSRRNLAALPVERHDVVEAGEDGPQDGTFHLLSGNSLFTSSRVLVLDDLVRELTGTAIPAQGALVGIPSSHQLLFHPVDAKSGTVPSLVVATMMTFTERQFGRTSGALSPHLYWWRAGELTQLTEGDGTRLSAELPPGFLDLVDTAKAPGELPRAPRTDADRARRHHYQFAHSVLPAAAGKYGPALVRVTPADGYDEMLADTWYECGAELPPEQRLSPDGLVSTVTEADGHRMLLVVMPRAAAPTEAICAAMVLPAGQDTCRYLVLEHAHDPVTGEPGAVVGEWADGAHLLLRLDASPDPAAFPALVAEVLADPGPEDAGLGSPGHP